MALPFMQRSRPANRDLAYRRLEEGVRRPVVWAPSDATRKFIKAFMVCFMIGFGTVLLACCFVYRYAFHDPDFVDNFQMIAFSISALVIIGIGVWFANAEDLET
ncbi:unnamed protein product [Urochloa decumbens]|uniref:Uncharacterized protein n=1 Tax=Urochloa decumbens TaxID=240449 RepID=A0ABC8YMX7_9POAL